MAMRGHGTVRHADQGPLLRLAHVERVHGAGAGAGVGGVEALHRGSGAVSRECTAHAAGDNHLHAPLLAVVQRQSQRLVGTLGAIIAVQAKHGGSNEQHYGQAHPCRPV